MKNLLFISLLSVFSLNVYAQDNNSEYEMKPDEKLGYIIDKNGNKIEGIVRLAEEKYPWENQKKVKFIASSDIDKSKKRQKLKTFGVDDIKGYMAVDNNTERRFEIIKYTNTKEGLNTATGGLSGGLKTFNNLTKNTQFAELVADGKIKVYKLYGFPTGFAAGSQIAVAEEETERLRENPSYIYSKNGGKPEELTLEKAKTIVADCPLVKGKIANGDYASLKDDTKKRSGIGKLIKSTVDKAMSDNLSIVNEVITDYNENCK